MSIHTSLDKGMSIVGVSPETRAEHDLDAVSCDTRSMRTKGVTSNAVSIWKRSMAFFQNERRRPHAPVVVCN